VPIEVITLLVWWIYQSASVSQWYNPISTFSLATVLLQWGMAMGLFVLYNRKIADKTTG
jgi:NSS family neurotransmitter:Na+ symporter